MTLRDYWDIVRRSWVIIVISTLAGLILGLGLSLATTPVYQAQAQLFVSVQSADEVYSAYSGGLFVQERVTSYVDIVDSPGVLEDVIDELALDVTVNELAGQVSANAPRGTVLLNVVGTSTDPALAAEIANTAAEALGRQIVRLETTESGAKPVRAQLIKPADEPTAPVTPRTQLNMALGGLLGLMVGVGVAVLRHTLDTTVKTSDDVEAASGSTSLGTVLFDPEAKDSPLVTLRGSARGEAFRMIRTNLRYVDVDNPPRTVVITSSVPGEGKTTTACNLAIAMAQAGAKVLLVEADMRRPRVADYLGVDGSVGLTDVLIGLIEVDTAILKQGRGLPHFLPSGAIPPNPSELLGSRHMGELLQGLGNQYDVILLDTPPLLPVTDAAILATAADGALLISRHGSTRREQVQAAAESLEQVGARLLGTVLNFAPAKRGSQYGYGTNYGYGYGYGQRSKGEEGPGGRRLLSPNDMPEPQPHA